MEVTAMQDTAVLMKKQLLWTRITAALLLLILVILVVGLILFNSFLKQASALVDQVNDLIVQIESVAGKLDTTAGQLADVDWESVGKNLQTISEDLSSVDWELLTDNISNMAVKAEESLRVAQKAIEDLDITTLNEAITELRDVIRPLANLVNRFS